MGKRGPMPGTGGRPRKTLSEKLSNDSYGYKTFKVIPAPANYEGADIPEPSAYIKAKQKNGKPLYAEEIYRNTWGWLKLCKCDHLFVPAIIEEYAMSISRWIQCEEAVSEYGFLAKHPTTGQPVTSPYVSMSQSYMKQALQQWNLIYEIVKENCTEPLEGATPHEDAMEKLLRCREGRV